MTQLYPHLALKDHFRECDLAQPADRAELFADYGAENVILLRNTALAADFDLLRGVTFPQLWKYKKMPASLLESEAGLVGWLRRDARHAAELEEFRTRVFDGDAGRLDAFMEQFESVNRQIRALMGAVLSGMTIRKTSVIWRFAETRAENLHFDNEADCEREESFRLYWNVDDRPRIWHTTESFTSLAGAYYRELDLGRFVGQPAERMANELSVRLFGGWQNRGREQFPRHMLMLEPGEVWFSDGRTVPHQVIYGRRVIMARSVVDRAELPPGFSSFADKVAALHAAGGIAVRPAHLPPPFPPGGAPRPEGAMPVDLKADWERLYSESVGEGLHRV